MPPLHSIQRRLINVLIFVFAVAVWGPHVAAERLLVGTLPGKVRAAGFAMSLEMEATSGNGYQPLYLKFLPIGKGFVRDRQLEVRINPRHDGSTKLDYVYRRPVTIPQGTGRWELPVYLPHYVPWDTIRVEILEDGAPIDSGSQTLRLPGGLRSRDAEQRTLVGVLTADLDVAPNEPWQICPDVRTLITVLGDGPLPEDVSVDRLDHATAVDRVHAVQPAAVQFRPFDEDHLQQDWLGYSQLDVIMVAAPLLERMEATQPERFQDLMSWLVTGGNLWVYAADRSTPGSFLQRLDLSDLSKRSSILLSEIDSKPELKGANDNSELIYEQWSGVIQASGSYSRAANLTLSKREDIYAELMKEKHPFTFEGKVKDVLDGVQLASYGLGFVVTIDADDPFPGSFQFWNLIAKSQDFGQLDFRERMGIDVQNGNANYWMWLLPSVGQPPVKSFVLLNTLFVVLIGPVCYWVLRKRRRLYFLYFVAPCLALLVTASLFAYAVGSDGTTTKVRSRQVTWIDTESGYHIEQTRQTYYAVFGSGDGIELNADTAVFPVRNTPAFNRYDIDRSFEGRRGDMLISNDMQLLGGTFLPPRNQVQYLTMLPIPSKADVAFEFEPEGGRAVNGLTVNLSRLLVCDRSGRLWECGEIKAGESVELRRAGPDALERVLGPKVLPPLGEVPMLRNNVVRVGGGLAGVQISNVERTMQKWSTNLPRGKFVGLADVLDKRIGVEGARVLDSVHVVMGDVQ